MSWQLPPAGQTWKAIELYLAAAYVGGFPQAVRGRLDALKSAGLEEFYHLTVFERVGEEPTRLSLRLGNRFYPHMKLVIERSPDGTHALFRADTHDRHVQIEPGSSEANAFAELARNNQALAQRIETSWDEAGIPTFKRFLRDDLARRRVGLDV